jgi:hypothetical protein
MTTNWQIAQINVGRLVAPPGDPRVQPFMDAHDRINAIADVDPDFVWRLKDESGNATGLRPTPDPCFAVNMSIWGDANALFNFVYRSAHTEIMAQRRGFFERFEGAFQALWWIPAGHILSIDEGLSRLWRLDRYGPTPHAFTFNARFPAPGLAVIPIDMNPDPWCAGRA